MDKRKLIGTIIGVVMFAALIAGATFAWLTFTANVVNATYNGVTQNFIVDYTQGSAVNGNLKQYTTGQATPANTTKLVVVAKKHEDSVDGHMTIKLTTTAQTSNIMAVADKPVVHWVICRDPDVEEGTQVDDVCSTNFNNASNSGMIKATGEIVLLSDAALAEGSTDVTTPLSSDNNTYLIEEDGVSYFVYFWLDAEQITSAHIGAKFDAYIHASASQIIE